MTTWYFAVCDLEVVDAQKNFKTLIDAVPRLEPLRREIALASVDFSAKKGLNRRFRVVINFLQW